MCTEVREPKASDSSNGWRPLAPFTNCTVQIGGTVADRILALAGPGKGPKVYTGNFKTVRAKICGLPEDGMVIITGDEFLRTVGNGTHEMPSSSYVSCEYQGKSFMICTLHAG